MATTDQEQEERTESVTLHGERSYLSYTLLIVLYQALFGGFVLLYRRWRHPLEQVTPLDLTLLGLATMRLSKLVSEDEITAALREPFIDESSGTKQPKGHGMRRSLGKLVLCPTCTGTWVAAFLSYALHLSPRYARPFLAMMAASGISQTSDAVLSLVYTDRDLLRKSTDQ
ncbi:MAG: DUF1360 domain-containing protein [Chloroflexota bacterium]|nr:DUF1360 domain-containing protein [Chloroflexota bacterium]